MDVSGVEEATNIMKTREVKKEETERQDRRLELPLLQADKTLPFDQKTILFNNLVSCFEWCSRGDTLSPLVSREENSLNRSTKKSTGNSFCLSLHLLASSSSFSLSLNLYGITCLLMEKKNTRLFLWDEENMEQARKSVAQHDTKCLLVEWE